MRREHNRRVSRWTWPAVCGAALVVLAYGSVLVFQAFDRDSHSASDTLRPFVITIGPIWLIAIAATVTLIRRTDR